MRCLYKSLLPLLLMYIVVNPVRANEPEYEIYFKQFQPIGPGKSCDARNDGSREIVGTIVSWLSGLFTDVLDRAAQARLKQYTASYGNNLLYVDFDDPKLWLGNGDDQVSCFMLLRAPKVNDPDGPKNTKDAALVLAGRLWKNDEGLRVAAEVLEWNKLKAKHSGGDAAISASLVIHSVRNAQDGGKYWVSPEVLLVSEEVTVNKAKRKLLATGPGDIDLELGDSGQADFDKAKLLPLPPKLSGISGKSIVAFEITVAEAGRPSSGLKAWAKFLSDNKDELSGALADAIGKVVK